MTTLSVAIAVSGLLIASAASMAQDTVGYPDMRGQWKGTNEGVVLGSGKHHRDDGKPGEPGTISEDFILNIKGQDGRKFWGEVTSKDDRGTILGIFASDKQTIYVVGDEGGHGTGKLLAPNRFELCYLRADKDIMVAACNVHTKQ